MRIMMTGCLGNFAWPVEHDFLNRGLIDAAILCNQVEEWGYFGGHTPCHTNPKGAEQEQ
jgi:hypothetical protein